MNRVRTAILVLTGVAAMATLRCGDIGAPFVPPVSEVVVVPQTSVNVVIGDHVWLELRAFDPVGRLIKDVPVTWKLSAETVVRFDEETGMQCELIANAPGQTSVTATCKDITSDPVVITVRKPNAVSVTVSPAGPIRLDPEGTQLFTAEVRDPGGTVIPGASVTWQSSNDEIVSIDDTGLASADGIGTAQITASSQGETSEPVVVTVATPGPSYATDIQPIFSALCVRCHPGQGEFSLANGYSNLVNVRATQSALMRVLPGDADQSYLYIKLTACTFPNCVGQRMPVGGSLTPAQIP